MMLLMFILDGEGVDVECCSADDDCFISSIIRSSALRSDN